MEITTITELYVFVLAGFVGYQVITRVPPLLHTPLMSATNAISAISVVGAMVIAGAHYNRVSTILGFIAVASATVNVVGGFLITDRMLRMFRPAGRRGPEGPITTGAAAPGKPVAGATPACASPAGASPAAGSPPSAVR
jgi:H+-translocating NAD(P) transhydrogenase subunit alpha